MNIVKSINHTLLSPFTFHLRTDLTDVSMTKGQVNWVKNSKKSQFTRDQTMNDMAGLWSQKLSFL